MKSIPDIGTALKLFEEAATKHAQYTEQGDYRSGNKSYETIKACVDFLTQEAAIEKLSGLLNASSVGPRLWAASFLLPTHEKECIPVLENIVEIKGIHSLSAKTTLR